MDKAADCTTISRNFVEQLGLPVHDFHKDVPSMHDTNDAGAQTVICPSTIPRLTLDKRAFPLKVYVIDENLKPCHLVLAKTDSIDVSCSINAIDN